MALKRAGWHNKGGPGLSHEGRGSPAKTAKGIRQAGRREDGFLCKRLSLERKVLLNAPARRPNRGLADGYHRHAAYSWQPAAFLASPSPSLLCIFKANLFC